MLDCFFFVFGERISMLGQAICAQPATDFILGPYLLASVGVSHGIVVQEFLQQRENITGKVVRMTMGMQIVAIILVFVGWPVGMSRHFGLAHGSWRFSTCPTLLGR